MTPQKIRKVVLFCALVAVFPGAHAARTYSNKPIYLEADEANIDDARQISVFTGNVKLTQGTLVIAGDQIVVTQDKSGLKHGTATGNPASFRQQRQGSGGYVEGSGDRIEYDAASEIMNIYGQAHVKRDQDDVHGEHITYNARTEAFQVSGAGEPHADEKKHRVRVIIQPQAAAVSAPSSTEPLTIKPDTTLIKPKDNQ
jgi:lipopolysaccharide export system protein LptA